MQTKKYASSTRLEYLNEKTKATNFWNCSGSLKKFFEDEKIQWMEVQMSCTKNILVSEKGSTSNSTFVGT